MVDKPVKLTPVTFIRSNFKLIILGLIAMVIFHNYLILITLVVLLALVGIVTIQVARMIPHITIETVSASSILLGYLFGWKVGFLFGFITGTVGYIKASQIKLTTIVNALFMGFCGTMGALFAGFGWQFWQAFLGTYFLRANLGFLVFRNLNPDPIENIMHSYGDGAFNVLIVIHFMNAICSIVKPLIGG